MLFCGVLNGACVLFPAFPAHAKQQPPAVLKEIFKDFNQLEEHVWNQNWKGAAEGAINVKQIFLLLVPDIKKYSSSQTISLFAEVMGGLSQAIDSRDLAKSFRSFSMVQSVFVLAMEMYEYPVPPLVTCVEINIREALEKSKGASYDGVVREMQELIVLLSQAESERRKNGKDSKAISDFKMLLINAKMAAEVRDPIQTQDGLDAIQKHFRAFREVY
jgi:hypothetical protein